MEMSLQRERPVSQTIDCRLRERAVDGGDGSLGHCSGGNHAVAAVMMFKVRLRL